MQFRYCFKQYLNILCILNGGYGGMEFGHSSHGAMQEHAPNPAFWAAFGICLLVGLFPVWSADYFHSVDGPVHLYIVHLLDRIGDKANYDAVFHRNYTPEPNLTVYGVIWLLSRLVPMATAEKLFISIYWLLFAFGAIYFVRSSRVASRIHHSTITFGLFALPFAMGYFLHWGFYNFVLSQALFLIFAGYALRHLQGPRLPSLLLLSAAMLLSAFTHLIGAAMLMAYLGLARVGVALRDGIGTDTSATGINRWRMPLVALVRDGFLFLAAAAPALALIISFVIRRVLGDELTSPELGILTKLGHIAILSPAFSVDQRELLVLTPFVIAFWAVMARLLWAFRQSPGLMLEGLPVLLPPITIGLVMIVGSLGFAGFDAMPRLLPFALLMTIPALSLLPAHRKWDAAIIASVTAGMIGVSILHAQLYRQLDGLYATFAQEHPPVSDGSAVLYFQTRMEEKMTAATPTGWRMDLTAHFVERLGREKEIILVNIDLLEPMRYGYFPINYDRDAKLAATWKVPKFQPHSMPIRDFEDDTDVEISAVAFWPSFPEAVNFDDNIEDDREAILRNELRQDWRQAPRASPYTPVFYVPLE